MLPPAMRSALGHTQNGEPLSNNRAPAEDLAPWVARVYATQVEMDKEATLICGLLSDTPVLRVLFSGKWRAETKDGIGRYGPSALLFGAQTKRMPVRVTGSFATVGLALKPGAMAALRGPKVSDTLDRIILYDHIYGHKEWGTSERMIEWFDPAGPPERWLKVAEYLFRDLLALTGAKRPDPVIEDFDKAAFANPNLVIADFAKEHGVERRTLERSVKKAFGMTPKQVLRRARVLDIAAHLRGVADNREEEEAALRFFDQSHMIREINRFVGRTPARLKDPDSPYLSEMIAPKNLRELDN